MADSNTPKVSSKLTIALIIVGIVVLIVVVTKLKSLGKAWIETRDRQSEQAVLGLQGMKLSYSKSWYSDQGRKLYTAMKSTWYVPWEWGTDENAIFAVFGQLKNDLDFLELYNAYGIKEGYDLQEWIEGDLSGYDIEKINRKLKNAGLTKRV